MIRPSGILTNCGPSGSGKTVVSSVLLAHMIVADKVESVKVLGKGYDFPYLDDKMISDATTENLLEYRAHLKKIAKSRDKKRKRGDTSNSGKGSSDAEKEKKRKYNALIADDVVGAVNTYAQGVMNLVTTFRHLDMWAQFLSQKLRQSGTGTAVRTLSTQSIVFEQFGRDELEALHRQYGSVMLFEDFVNMYIMITRNRFVGLLVQNAPTHAADKFKIDSQSVWSTEGKDYVAEVLSSKFYLCRIIERKPGDPKPLELEYPDQFNTSLSESMKGKKDKKRKRVTFEQDDQQKKQKTKEKNEEEEEKREENEEEDEKKKATS